MKKHQGTSLLLQQFKGMFIKGMIMTWRNRVIAAVQIMVPVVFTLLGLIPTGGETWEESPPSVPRVLSVGNSEDQIVSTPRKLIDIHWPLANIFKCIFLKIKGVKFDSNLPNYLILSTIPNKTLFGIASVKYFKPPP